ncbi:M1 family aminopeptidase, partial [Massilia pinisoli]|uniref:M1 family aminopeptidase n=1 Tax=Massilia pinisoli TaxID=1772194 RepID=UPI003631AD93
INNYGINMNVGNYEHFNEIYDGEKGKLTLDYYVLPENLEKAKTQFKQVPMMLKAFEHWFGPYPFYEDGYKLVDVPYLGMEHQSSVTYGNKYNNGYLGRDLSGTGWGLKWDFIIVHESGHEWFANNITYKDMADMWIHESFTNYSENLYTEYYFGKEAGAAYVIGCR